MSIGCNILNSITQICVFPFNRVQELAAEGKKVERQLYERMKRCTIFDPELVAIDEFPSDVESEDEEEEPEIIEFSPEQQKKIQFAVSGPRNDVCEIKLMKVKFYFYVYLSRFL